MDVVLREGEKRASSFLSGCCGLRLSQIFFMHPNESIAAAPRSVLEQNTSYSKTVSRDGDNVFSARRPNRHCCAMANKQEIGGKKIFDLIFAGKDKSGRGKK